jgi:hypothetical protein
MDTKAAGIIAAGLVAAALLSGLMLKAGTARPTSPVAAAGAVT